MLNAIVDSRFEEALEDARQVDAMLSADNFLENAAAIEKDYPLLGKNLIGVLEKYSITIGNILFFKLFHACSFVCCINRSKVSIRNPCSIITI